MIELLVHNNSNKKTYDLSRNVKPLKISTEIQEQPGKLTIEYINDNDVVITEGSSVSLKSDSNNMFFGYVFNVEPDKNGEIVKLTVYDSKRYLKFKDTIVVTDKTASQLFAQVCENRGIKYRIDTPSSYVIKGKINDNVSLNTIVEDAIDETLAMTGKWYTVVADYDTLVFTDLDKLKTPLIIGNNSAGLGFKFKSSIDEDTYNYIKLAKDNKQTNKREIYAVYDSNAIGEWGTLQYFEKVDEGLNSAQIQSRAEMLLKVKNRKTRSLRLSCVGDYRVKAGSGVWVDIDEIKKYGVNGPAYFFVQSCTHEISNSMHKMELDLIMG